MAKTPSAPPPKTPWSNKGNAGKGAATAPRKGAAPPSTKKK